MINYKEIEAKWQKAWADAKIFEPEINDKEGIMVINAFPYVNAPLHIGHFRSYGTAEAYSRYLRLRGFNVLFPFGFHATGTPVTAFARRIANKDQDLIDELEKLYHIPHEEVVKMSDPAYIAEYMIKRQERILGISGLGIDWRRKFITIDPIFSKMVEWQFQKLYEKGYLIKGKHPVAWCPLENHAVGENDTKHDVHPKIEEVVAVKFKDTASNIYFACATYRPETIYGVTNLFVNEKVDYVIAEIEGNQHYMSKGAADALQRQLKINVIGTVSAADLLKKKAINPVTKEEVPVLPGYFVKPDVGTGVVMSVPSHAPFDYVALDRLRSAGYPLPKIEYKKILEIEEDKGKRIGRTLQPNEAKGRVLHPEIPALAYLELVAAKIDSDDSAIERVTKMVYREEARHGIMLVGAYKGRKEPEAREGLKNDLVRSGDALLTYEITNDDPVYCRDGTKIVVNVVTDQWFINYGDGEWKKGVRDKLKGIKIYPKKYESVFSSAVDWLDLRAAERAHGLGTKFPYNPEHIIESLSDSTIYMVFYTFSNVLRQNNINAEQLKPKFFDYVLNSVGDISDVSKDTGIDEVTIKKCKESFEYWYARTSSHTATEHVYNHLVMYLYNHLAVLSERFFPKQVAVNGMLLFEGEKMSKSLGNIVPLEDGIAKYGADALRAICVTGSELDSVSDFTPSAAVGVMQKNEFLMGIIDTLGTMKVGELEPMDFWLYSKLNKKVKDVTDAMDNIEFRGAFNEAYYNSIGELKQYLDFGGRNQIVMRDFLNSLAIMIAPIMPHMAEEFWQKLGNPPLVAQQRWPEADESMINSKVEKIVDVVAGVIDDAANVLLLTSRIDANKGKRPKEFKVIIADDWKRIALTQLVELRELSKVMKSDQMSNVDKEKASRFLGPFMSKLQTLHKPIEMTSDELYAGFVSSRDYIGKKLGADVTIERESSSASQRASRAMPDKPSIDIVWG